MRKFHFSFLAMAFFLSSISLHLCGQEGRIVEEIIIEGNVRISDAAILARLKTRVNEPFSQEAVNEDIKNLHKEGYFFPITVEFEEGEKGIRVIFRVRENPYVQKFTFRGNSQFKERELISELDLEGVRFISNFILEAKKKELEKFYKEKGYFFVQVRYEVLSGEKGSVVVFHVIEGPRVKVERIVFHGNEETGGEEIRDVMNLEEAGFFRSGIFNYDVMVEDIRAIKDFYRQRGYRDIEAYPGWLDFSEDKSSVTVNIIIHEGKAYAVEALQVQGNDVFTSQEILALIRLKPGDAYRRDEFEDGLRAIWTLYRENAFLDVIIEPKEIFSEEGNRVTLVVDVQEGRKIRVGKINIKGNILTRDEVIRRALEVYPGQEINVKKLERSVERLRSLLYFQPDKVRYRFAKTGDPDVRDLEIEVEEGSTGNFNLAAGVGSNSGFLGMIAFRKRNFDIADLPASFNDVLSGNAFTGGGQSLVLELTPGTEVTRFRFGFDEPYLFGTENSAGMDLYRYLRIYPDYDISRTGAGFKLGRAYGPDWYSSLSYRGERVEVDDVDTVAPRDVWNVEGSNSLRSLEATLACDKRDSRLTPSEGFQISLSGEYGGNFLGGDFGFSKLITSADWHYTLYRDIYNRKHIFHLLTRVGWGEANDGSPEIPVFERFYAGGLNSLRAFEFRGVGPHEEGEPIGGDFLWVNTVEYDFPLYERMLRGVLFVDFGKVEPDIHNRLLDDMRAGVGFGFRFFIPFLGPIPFEINFGFPLLEEDDDKSELISFSIGHPFNF